MRGSRVSLFLSLLAFAGIGLMILVEERDRREEQREAESVEASEQQARRHRLATEAIVTTVARCRREWQEALSVYAVPKALAWNRGGLDGYVLEGADGSSWRSLRCDERGVRRGPRVVPALAERMPAEDPGEAAVRPEDELEEALRRLGDSPPEPRDYAIEILTDPLTGRAIVRRWRGVEGGARPELEPADAPVFPWLLSDPAFPIVPGIELPALEELPRYRWAAESEAAFALLERELPPEARISELNLDDDRIDIQILGPIRAFEGRPPAPYGDLEWDEYGVADRAFWYPRDDPGFGCSRGLSLAEVRAAFAEALKGSSIRKLSVAWYSCNPSLGDGREGEWQFAGR